MKRSLINTKRASKKKNISFRPNEEMPKKSYVDPHTAMELDTIDKKEELSRSYSKK